MRDRSYLLFARTTESRHPTVSSRIAFRKKFVCIMRDRYRLLFSKSSKVQSPANMARSYRNVTRDTVRNVVRKQILLFMKRTRTWCSFLDTWRHEGGMEPNCIRYQRGNQ